MIKTKLLHSWAFIPGKWKFLHTKTCTWILSAVSTSLKLKTTQISFNRWMVKPTGVAIPRNTTHQWKGTIDIQNNLPETLENYWMKKVNLKKLPTRLLCDKSIAMENSGYKELLRRYSRKDITVDIRKLEGYLRWLKCSASWRI